MTQKNEKEWPEKNGKVWLKKWEGLTWKNGNGCPEKMRRSDLKNEKDLFGKVGRADSKEWEGLTRRNGKVWLEKWEVIT